MKPEYYGLGFCPFLNKSIAKSVPETAYLIQQADDLK